MSASIVNQSKEPGRKAGRTGRKPPDKDRDMYFWLLIIPLIVLLLVLCSHSALMGGFSVTHADAQTNLDADYGPWNFLSIGVLRKQVVSAIRADLALINPFYSLSDPVPGEGSFLINDSLDDSISADLRSLNLPDVTGTLSSNSVLPTQDSSSAQLTQTALAASGTPDRAADATQTATGASVTDTSTGTVEATATTGTAAAATHTASPTATHTAEAAAATATASATIAATQTASTAPTATDTETAADPEETYWFSDDVVSVSGEYRMVPYRPSGSIQNKTNLVSFETENFVTGSMMQSGNTNVIFYAVNILPGDKTVHVTLYSGWRSLGSRELTIPGSSTTPALYTLSVPTSSHEFGGDARFLMVDFMMEGGVRIFWDGAYNDSRCRFPALSPP